MDNTAKGKSADLKEKFLKMIEEGFEKFFFTNALGIEDARKLEGLKSGRVEFFCVCKDSEKPYENNKLFSRYIYLNEDDYAAYRKIVGLGEHKIVCTKREKPLVF